MFRIARFVERKRERKIDRWTKLAIDTIVLLTHGVIAGDHSGSVSTHLLCTRGENICRGGEETERRCGDTRCSHGPDNGPFVRHCVRGTLIVSLRPDDLRGYDSPPPPLPSSLRASHLPAVFVPFSSARPSFPLARFPWSSLMRQVERGGGGGGLCNSSTVKLSHGINAVVRLFCRAAVTCYFADDYHGRQHNPSYDDYMLVSESF